jgi:hypothetical protein
MSSIKDRRVQKKDAPVYLGERLIAPDGRAEMTQGKQKSRSGCAHRAIPTCFYPYQLHCGKGTVGKGGQYGRGNGVANPIAGGWSGGAGLG